jgi:general secretion pathway protein G
MKLHMKKAFTLVEMLIVIVIIGILAAALISRLTGIQGRARDVARQGDLQSITQALAVYQLDSNGSYPAGNTTTSGQFIKADTLSGVLAGYLKSFPVEKRDPANNPYAYASNGTVAAVAAFNETNKGNWNAAPTYLVANLKAISPTVALTSAEQSVNSTGNASIIIQ